MPGGARGWEKRRGFMGGLAPFFYNRGLGWSGSGTGQPRPFFYYRDWAGLDPVPSFFYGAVDQSSQPL